MRVALARDLAARPVGRVKPRLRDIGVFRLDHAGDLLHVDALAGAARILRNGVALLLLLHALVALQRLLPRPGLALELAGLHPGLLALARLVLIPLVAHDRSPVAGAEVTRGVR